MNELDRQKMYKEDGFEDEYYKVSKDNLDYYATKGTWLAENYNSMSRNISERLSALIGVSIGLLPLMFGYLTPQSEIEIYTIVCILILLVSSIIAGNMDSMLSLHFWDKNATKNRQTQEIWRDTMQEISDHYPDSGEDIYNQAGKKITELELNKNLKVSEIPLLLQIVTAMFAIAFQVFYLYIKVLG